LPHHSSNAFRGTYVPSVLNPPREAVPGGKFCTANDVRKLNKLRAMRCATTVRGGRGFVNAVLVGTGDGRLETWASTATRGSMEIPRVIVGEGSVMEVGTG
jgi:hypothetical protein